MSVYLWYFTRDNYRMQVITSTGALVVGMANSISVLGMYLIELILNFFITSGRGLAQQ